MKALPGGNNGQTYYSVNPVSAPASSKETIEFKYLLKKVWDNWYLFAACLALVLGLAFVYLKFANKTYAVRSSIITHNNENPKFYENDIFRQYNLKPQASIEDEIGMLSQHAIAHECLRRLEWGVTYFSEEDLKERQELNNVPFTVQIDSTAPQYLGLKVYVKVLDEQHFHLTAKGKDVTVYDFKNDRLLRESDEIEFDKTFSTDKQMVQQLGFSISIKPEYNLYQKDKYYFTINKLDDLATVYKDKIELTRRADKGSIIDIVSKGSNSEVEKTYLNTLMKVYLEKERESNEYVARRAMELIDEEIETLTDSLRKAETEKAKVRSESQIVSVDATTQLLTQDLHLFNMEHYNENKKLSYYDQALAAINTPSTNENHSPNLVAPSTVNIEDPVLDNYMIQLSNLERELAAAKQEVNVGGDINLLKSKINVTRNMLKSSLENARNSSVRVLAEISKRRGRTIAKIRTVPKSEKELDQLDRELSLAEDRYRDLQHKRSEVAIMLATIKPTQEVLDYASADKQPVSPKKGLVMLLALLAGLAIPTSYLFVKEYFNEKIDEYSTIAEKTAIPLLGFISKAPKNNKFLHNADADMWLAESFRSVKVHMDYLFPDINKQVIGITSSVSGEGKSFCSTNLALTLAYSKKRTVLIDADLRKARVAPGELGDDFGGLSTYLSGEQDLKEVIRPSEVSKLDIIPAGPVNSNSVDLLNSDRLASMIEELRHNYDHIIWDTPPIGLVPDYLILQPYMDFNIYIVRYDYTNVNTLRHINELYDSGKISNVSILINDAKPDSGYSASKYGYYGVPKLN